MAAGRRRPRIPPPAGDEDVPEHGPDSRLDVYLADLGTSLYGYCAPDVVDGQVRTSAYCVLDNDYDGFDGSQLANLEVTAAHEFFHTVQFAYDVKAATWLMEGTAAWVEGEVYDDINDNLQYLYRSALSAPNVPLDYIGKDDDTGDPAWYAWRYGSWIWWRFLSEYFGPGKSDDPSVVRQVWERVGRGEGSLQALRNVVQGRGRSFADVFADFGAVNRTPGAWYAEGRRYERIVAPPAGRYVLGKAQRGTGPLLTSLPHLSSQHAVFQPGATLTGRWRLRLDLNLPDRDRGSKATVLVHRPDGRTRWLRVALDRRGDARLSVPFDRGSVSSVVLTLTNSSTRADGLSFAFDARTVR